jgi:hypothetical protein
MITTAGFFTTLTHVNENGHSREAKITPAIIPTITPNEKTRTFLKKLQR